MKKNISRREFLETTTKGAAALAIGNGLIDNLQAHSALVNNAATVGNNAKNASSVISLPKGGGAIKGIGETFQPNPFTGTANLSVPIATSPGRNGFGPQLSLQYSSGNGNGPFGMGWSLSLPQISRKTEQGIPKYNDTKKVDETEKDSFILSGAEDLVLHADIDNRQENGFIITHYRPRTEGLFAKIEKWEQASGIENKALNPIFWKITTKDNITNIYGFTQQASLAKPGKNRCIFQWFLELTFDAKGNYVYYEYKSDKAEDLDKQNKPFEEHRFNINKDDRPIYQVYLKAIRYGNQSPFSYAGHESLLHLLLDNTPSAETNFFNVVFDYGKQHIDGDIELINSSVYSDINGWVIREDPFSFYRASFENRWYRRVKRVMTFHNIPGHSESVLVKSTDFKYTQNEYNNQSELVAITQRGYRRKSATDFIWCESEDKVLKSQYYHIKSLPPLEFTYSEFNPKGQKFKPIENENNEFPSTGLSNPNMTFVDLFGTALPDLLETTPAGYFYLKNLGNGKFARKDKLKNAPAGVTLSMAGVGFGDMAGDGKADLLVHQGLKWGFWEADQKGGWANFRTYKSQPAFELNDPNIRLVDLTGDGKSDILKMDDRSLVYYKCKGEEGFEAPEYPKRIHDLKEFPDIYFTDPRVRLADMTGDGLQDIVIVHSGRIDYYPNLGYGIFGKQITMKGAPHFGADFDPKRLFLVDIDGSGTCDLVYVESGIVRLWFNQSGNAFSKEMPVSGTPQITNSDSLQFVDILGNGSNCLVYSTDYKTPGRSNYWYLDFSGGTKPNVLIEMNNNLGAITKATYKPSTTFYLLDRLTQPWLTSLPFPVQVLEKVEVIDTVSRTKLVTQYKYHNGYYNREREFAGFAMVEQIDTEYYNDFSKVSDNNVSVLANTNKAFYAPPAYTKTWYHTGAYNDEIVNEKWKKSYGLSENTDFHNLFSREYYKGDKLAIDLPNSVLEANALDIKSIHEAYRAMRGCILRQEVYALDGLEKSKHPYVVTESNFRVKLLQGKRKNKHAVFYVYPNETLSYHYERNPNDPRIGHEITLAIDEYGNVTDKVSIAYPRHLENNPLPEQQKTKIIYAWNHFINKDKETDFYCLGVACESKSFEVIGIEPNEERYLSKSDLIDVMDNSKFREKEYSFTRTERDLNKYKRILKWNRSYFRKNNAAAEIDITKDVNTGYPLRTNNSRLDLGNIESLMLPYEQYHAAFSNTMVDQLYGKYEDTNESRVKEEMLKCAGYYYENGYWWVPSGQQAFSEKFYLPVNNVDPLGNIASIKYELDLMPISSEDAFKNITIAKNDYYTLQPYLVTDPNQNRTQVAFDALGMVVGAAIMGKESKNEGDTLDGFNACLDYNVIQAHINDPINNNPYDLLKGATSVILYDLWRNKKSADKSVPVAGYTISREIHHNDLANGETSPIQRSILYSDGFGHEIQTKIEVESGETTPDQIRWIASGWKIYNNKGKPVMQFEPFFSDTHEFEYNRQIGVSPVIFYDPLERVVATLHPNHTYEKVKFDAWLQETWDTNDTVLLHPKNDGDIKGFVEKYFETNTGYITWYNRRIPECKELSPELICEAEQKSATQTEKHQNTPAILYLDNLSRPFKTRQDNGTEKFDTVVELDIEGNEVKITDPMGIDAFKHKFTMTGEKVFVNSVDAGIKYNLSNVLGNPVHSWDANGNHLETKYDKIQRPIEAWITDKDHITYLVQRTIYGENKETSVETNHRLQVYQVYDGAGLIINNEFDFKGNLRESTRKMIPDYKQSIDWNNTPEPVWGNDTYTVKNKYDALNRIFESEAPDNSKHYFYYNRTGLLKAVSVQLKGETNARKFVNNIVYNEKGQRNNITYENGVTTEYSYEPDTFRLSKITSKKNNGKILQDLSYSYDPVGNIIQISDAAFHTVFNANDRVDAKSHYTYDAIYRLTEAKGREHEAMSACHYQKHYSKHTEFIPITDQPVNNGQAIYNYTETYTYDKSGNIKQIFHNGKAGARTRNQEYATDSNRILTSRAGCALENNFSFIHDANGNMLNMAHLPEMKWNYANQLVSVKLNIKTNGTDDQVFYNYDAGGQRVRKVIEQGYKRVEERIYVGGYEIYKKYSGTNITFKRSTLHVMDDTKRIALIERKLEDLNGTDAGPEIRIRYHLDNHLGSSSLELDENAKEISYEEYYPYGSTSYMAGENETEVKLKRYRYSGKERDDETGLYYYGARYYIPWGRWLSCDPIGIKDGINLYCFIACNPLIYVDHAGLGKEEQSLGARNEELSRLHNEAGNPEVETKYQVTVGDCRIDELKTLPKRKNSLKGTTIAVERKARHLGSPRNRSEGGRKTDINKNLEQGKRQIQNLDRAGIKDSKSIVIRTLYDSDKGKTSKEVLELQRQEAAKIRQNWVNSAENATEKALRERVRLVVNTSDGLTNAIKFLKSERGFVSLPSSNTMIKLMRISGGVGLILLLNTPTTAGQQVVDPLDPHYFDAGVREGEYYVEAIKYLLGISGAIPKEPWPNLSNEYSEYDLYMATNNSFILGPIQPLVVWQVKEKLGYEHKWTDYLGVLGPIYGPIGYFFD